MKSLIIHTTCGKHEQLKNLLDLHGLFKSHYDGWEATLKENKVVSYRLYYYSVLKSDIYAMIKHLFQVGKPYTYKIRIGCMDKGEGNYAFD